MKFILKNPTEFALYITDNGKMQGFANKAGLSRQSLYRLINNDGAGENVAIKVSKCMGKKVKDIFLVSLLTK
jgi:DNA-binding phage protein